MYKADSSRYKEMKYNRCGNSGIKLPIVSLGLWHNFGDVDSFSNGQTILRAAFDSGITHFDLANNYGPSYGSAEDTFGKILATDFKPYRDELFISTKAGYDMWDGPYGNWGSRKYLISSLDQSLKRMGLDYVDVFYHHRPDPETPLEESMNALSDIVKSGKALYVAISNYPADEAQKAIQLLKENKTPCLLHQAKYSMLFRWPEEDLFSTLEDEGVGCIVFSPLAEGILTNKYIHGIPEGSRAASTHSHLKQEWITEERLEKVRALNKMAEERGQTLAQMALSWTLRKKTVTSVLVGASSVKQLNDNLGIVNAPAFTQEELDKIEITLDNKNDYSRNL